MTVTSKNVIHEKSKCHIWMGWTKQIGKELNIQSNTTIENLPKSILTAVSDWKSATFANGKEYT